MNPKILGEQTDGKPIVGNFSNRNCDRVESARLSISFSETNKSTSCPRSRRTSATAIPGKRCPPVPPHAMIAFMMLPIPGLEFPIGGATGVGGLANSWIRNLKAEIASDSWCYPHLESSSFFVGGFQNCLSIDIEKQTDPEQTGRQIGTPVADKRQRQTFVWEQ